MEPIDLFLGHFVWLVELVDGRRPVQRSWDESTARELEESKVGRDASHRVEDTTLEGC